MYALVEFDEILTKEQFMVLSHKYDLGKTIHRFYKDYDGKIKPMEDDEVYESEVIKEEVDGKVRFTHKDTGEQVHSYNVKQDCDVDMVHIEKRLHIADIEHLYDMCPKIQFKVLEIAK